MDDHTAYAVPSCPGTFSKFIQGLSETQLVKVGFDVGAEATSFHVCSVYGK